MATASCSTATVLTWAQLLIVVPVAWYRDLSALTAFNLIGNLLVFGTAVVLSIRTVFGLLANGAATDVSFTCPVREALTFMGFSVFAFEGINMVIPMYTAHRNKETFSNLLSITIIVIIAVFSTFAVANIMLYGGELQPILTQNMPAENAAAGLVPLAFGLASLALVPLMAFPAFEILEGAAQRACAPLVQSPLRVNVARALVLIFCATLAEFGGDHLQSFLALVGALACGPLSLIFPAIIHLRMVANTQREVVEDTVFIILGCAITVLSVWSTVSSV
mmetsp:Transcript_54103/g.99922  ORF Transcript_54103/g.99922 Transcript_54103/m.99922 type:complete len:278 (+) Transcript_54103:3-836(+)